MGCDNGSHTIYDFRKWFENILGSSYITLRHLTCCYQECLVTQCLWHCIQEKILSLNKAWIKIKGTTNQHKFNVLTFWVRDYYILDQFSERNCCSATKIKVEVLANIWISQELFCILRKGSHINNGHFTVNLTVSGGEGGSAPMDLTVSKCENFDPMKTP